MKPYEKLAFVYDNYWHVFSRMYKKFLLSAIKRHDIITDSVLELACGTGTLMAMIKSRCKAITGLDLSEEMLCVARQKEELKDCRLVQGDFTTFTFDTTFNLILLCFDSMNYVHSADDLDLLLSSVRKHLIKGGFFVFDVLNEKHFESLSGRSVDCPDDAPFAYQNQLYYDAQIKRFQSSFVFSDGDCEVHYQIPLEYKLVSDALSKNGFETVAVYGDYMMNQPDNNTTRFYFVVKAGE